MLTGLLDHGIINGKKKRLFFQRAGNRLDCFRYRNVIPNRVIIGICFQCIVKSVKRSVGQSGNHMAVGKTDRAKQVRSQNRNDQQEQVPSGRSGSRVKITRRFHSITTFSVTLPFRSCLIILISISLLLSHDRSLSFPLKVPFTSIQNLSLRQLSNLKFIT